jgi:hypothetical protein
MVSSKWNFFQKATVSVAEFPTDAQVKFSSQNMKFQVSFSLLNEGDTTVEYSFDGINLHGDLTPSTPSAGIVFDNRKVGAVWFRSAGTGQVIRVEAWSGF